MKRKYNKPILTLIGIFLLITPVNADALIWLNGNSDPGNITISAAVLIPLPFINLTITESQETDLLGIAQLTITGHDDNNKYNTLQISIGSDDPIELPISYGSFGLHYLILPDWPSLLADQSDIYVYLSVAYGRVKSTINCDINQTISIERDQLIELLTPFLPEGIDPYAVIGKGPFNVGFELNGELSDTATQAIPTISGNFEYSFTLPENIFIIPLDLPDIQGNALIEASFNWDNWNFFSPFTTVDLSITLTYEGEVTPLDPIEFDLLPGGTFILWLEKEE